MKFPPRDYQVDAVKAASAAITAGRSPLIVLPTGTGKAMCVAMISTMAAKRGRRVLNLTHRKTLIEQNYLELLDYAPGIDAGIYSAGLRRRDVGHSVMFGGVQSYVNHTYNAGRFDYIVVDEAHLIPPEGEGQYQKTIIAERQKNPDIKIIGLSATPYRMGQGLLTEGESAIFSDICYEADFLDMVGRGYLAPITSFRGNGSADMSGVHMRRGDFIESEAEQAFMHVLPAQVDAILRAGEKRKKWLIFATSIKHADAIGAAIGAHFETVVIHSEAEELDEKYNQFKHGPARCAVNVDMMTTGSNIPGIDMVALCRAMVSPVLLVQSVGRGTRPSPATGKTDCLVLDFGGNVDRHGPIDLIGKNIKSAGEKKKGQLAKACQFCDAYSPLAARVCENCGTEFPESVLERGKNLEERARNGGITSIEPTRIDLVSVMFYEARTKKNEPCLIVEFHDDGRYQPAHREWLLLWHSNEYAVEQAVKKLDNLTGGQASEFAGLSPDAMAEALTAAYEARLIPQITYILTMPDPKNPKFSRIVASGNDE